MDALKYLVANIPDWLNRLEELDGQIAKRQTELAQLAEPKPQSKPALPTTAVTRFLRNKGSQESLRPRDEREAHPNVAPIVTIAAPASEQPPSAEINQTRARAKQRSRQSSDSIIDEGVAPKVHTRSIIIVYYDSYEQLFFDDLVRFISRSRSLTRPAKIAAKVAEIKRLADMEVLDESDEEEAKPSTPTDAAISPLKAGPTENGGAGESLPSLLGARQMRSPRLLIAQPAVGRLMYARGAKSPPGLDLLEKDIYHDFDKGLEFVQSMCEHAAHRFLRDGSCAEKVGRISSRMAETKELADKELKRIQREEPDTLKADDDKSRGRSYRPPSMRKDLTSSLAKQQFSPDGDYAEEVGEIL
jgi:hypothetical protein